MIGSPIDSGESIHKSSGHIARKRGRSIWILVLIVVLMLPLFVAVMVLREPRWYPFQDLAYTELRVRDVGSAEPPLIGLPGRIGSTTQLRGSHPGPISFWSMWPTSQLLGRSSLAMRAACATVHLAAIVLILWLAFRRGQLELLFITGAALVFLMRGFGAEALLQPWNPYLPLLWWVAFLFAVWAVSSGDLPVLPIAALAGSFCAQTHISYVGLVGGLAVLATLAAVRSVRTRDGTKRDMRSFAQWCLVSIGVLILVWMPPLIDQIIRSGNLSLIVDNFASPPESQLGLKDGSQLLLAHLNPGRLIAGDVLGPGPGELGRGLFARSGPLLPGVLLIAVWVSSVWAAVRLQHRSLLRLHAVVAAALLLGVITASRIFGFVFFWLVLWAWGIVALILIAISWTLSLLFQSRWQNAATLVQRVAPAAAIIVVAALFTVEASRVNASVSGQSASMHTLAPATVEALTSSSISSPRDRGHYLITWSDSYADNLGLSLLNELERDGFRAGVNARYRTEVRSKRVLERRNASHVVHIAVGGEIDAWRARASAREIAYADPRHGSLRPEFGRLRRRVVDELRHRGLTALIPELDEGLADLPFRAELPTDLQPAVARMLDLGIPVAVFLESTH